MAKSAAAGNLVVVVGSGVSIEVTNNQQCASWQGLLRHGLDWARRRDLLNEPALNDLTASSDPTMLLAVAEVLRRKLPADLLKKWLQESVGKLSAEKPTLLHALKSLRAVFVTTNYDDLLARELGVPPVTWRDSRIVEVARGEPGVIHLHGHHADPDSVIIDFSSYGAVENDRATTAMWNAFDTIKTILYVGCGSGLSDPHFKALFQGAESFFKGAGPRQYVLCRTSEAAVLRAQLPAARLEPLAYGDRYEELPDYLFRLAQSATARDGLPRSHRPSAGPCVGRKADLAKIERALRSDSPPARIVILGQAGVGKTTVALKALERAGIQQVVFARCEAARDVEGLIRAIAAEQKIEQHDLADAVMSRLEQQRAVLLLDGIEHAWEGAQRGVEELLSHLAALDTAGLMVTLRGTIAPARVEWSLRRELRRLAAREARRVFLRIAGERYRHDPRLDEFLRAVGYLPLAIHVLAHRAQSESTLEALWEQWTRTRTRMLRRAAAPDKDNSVEDSFELSLESSAMTPAARRLLPLLAFLPDGIQPPLELVFDGGDEAASVLRGLGLLDSEAGERVRLFSLLAEYVATRDNLDPELLRSACRHYITLAVLGEELGDDSTTSVARTLSTEAANIEKILPIAIDYCEERDVAAAAVAFARFISYTGVGAGEAVEAVLGKITDSRLRARCLKAAADLAMRRSNLELAKHRYESARRLFEEVGDADGAAQCTLRLGSITLEPQQAVEHLREAQRQLTHAVGVHRRGHAAFLQADPPSNQNIPIADVAPHLQVAEQYFVSALRTFEEVGSDIGIAGSLRSLADVAVGRGDLARARELYEQAQRRYEAAGSRLGVATCTKGFGHISYHEGDYEQAERFYLLALPMYRTVAYSLGVANCLHALGKIHRKRRSRTKEQKALSEAAQIYHSIGARREEMKAVMKLAASYLATKHAHAVRKYGELITLAESLDEAQIAAEAHEVLARTVKSEARREFHRDSARATWLRLGRADRVSTLR